MISRLRLAAAVFIAVLPSPLKIWIYRCFFRYRIGRDVRIGFSVFSRVGECEIGDHVRIGHLNAFLNVRSLIIGEHARIGQLNMIRGGTRVQIGRYATILRANVLNSIVDAETVNPTHPQLILGDGAVITNNHWLDFTDAIQIGPHTIIGGRASSIWTHNRQRTKPITIGHHCYLGSDIRMAPGASIPDMCIVALGSVLLGSVNEARSLIVGNPAQRIRALRPSDYFLVTKKTRQDIPDGEVLLDDVDADAQDDLLTSATSVHD